jgi:hypothetical protein
MNPGDEIGRDDEATSGAGGGGGGGGGAARPPAAHVLIDEARSARWFVYRRQSSPLDPAVEWSDWGDVRDGARGANPQLAGLLEKNHARAVTAILDRTDWTGRGPTTAAPSRTRSPARTSSCTRCTPTRTRCTTPRPSPCPG